MTRAMADAGAASSLPPSGTDVFPGSSLASRKAEKNDTVHHAQLGNAADGILQTICVRPWQAWALAWHILAGVGWEANIGSRPRRSTSADTFVSRLLWFVGCSKQAYDMVQARKPVEEESDGRDIIKIVFAIFIPPVGVLLEKGIGSDFCINVILTILGYIPGIIHALYIILKY
ncbi:MAG: hypothetical protein LQ350_008532 [Teloschistes chrysophthalmus]|nr:MAG: hypothetical protein LQ350_008532 [Niorma chrysophthalma]